MAQSEIKTVFDLPGVRQILLLIGISGAVAAGAMVFFWSQKPGYQVLFSQMDDREAAAVVDLLMAGGIDYRLDPTSGAILVPSDSVHQARLELAAEGLPQGGGAGFEMIRKDQGFGVSQFVETARYQHALETELVRTITSLRSVRSARVHLAIPKASAFASDSSGASASVFVELFPGRELKRSQVDSIVHLVAAGIPDMGPERVAIIDQQGRLLSQKGTDDAGEYSDKQFEHVRRVEQSFARRIETLLTPMTGPGRISSQVAVDMDFTRQEETRETYTPDPQSVRSERISQARDAGAALPGGIPGAQSNKPGGAEADAGNDGQTGNSSVLTTRNYELDRAISHTQMPAARVRRISVAVLVDHIPARDAETGELAPAPLSEAQLERVEALVREAVGFDAERGDSVSVMNAEFQRPDPAPIEETPIWQQPIAQDMARQLLGALVLLVLGFAVLRPVLRNLVQIRPQHATVAMGADGALPDLSAAGAGAAGHGMHSAGGQQSGSGSAALEGPSVSPYEQKLAAAKSAVNEDPKRVAQVVKGWIGDDG